MASLRNSPYLPLYVDSFVSDEKLNECSASANGVYIRLLCLMHKSEEYGKITVAKGTHDDLRALFADKLARHMPFPWAEIYGALDELINHGVVYIDGLSLCQKRMVKDGRLSEKRSALGRLGMARRWAESRQDGAETEAAETPAGLFGDEVVEKPKKPKKQKPQKVAYAEAVTMTEAEFFELVSKYGESEARGMVELLNNHKLANGKKYVSDYRAILTWVVDAYYRKNGKNAGNNPAGFAGLPTAKSSEPRNYDESF